jgi:long-subunit acyl-CoA synthetase (AMP-forming)
VTRWRSTLHAALRLRAEPVLVFPDATIPGASVWTAARLWVNLLRERGVTAGDRVVLAWPASPGFVAFLVAAVWEGLTVAVVHENAGDQRTQEWFDARLMLGRDGLHADNAGCPLREHVPTREARLPKTTDIRLILRTSGTSGEPAAVALSDDNLWSGLDAHLPHVVQDGDTVLSVLPWHHAFGLVIDLIPALLRASVIVRDASGGRDPASVMDAARAWRPTWCSMVPLQAQRLADHEDGAALLRSLRGGIVGGAAAPKHVASVLEQTNLRVGYGQTEAAPGISLGEPGVWNVGALGTPRGCEWRVADDRRLLVRGPNVCAGFWTARGLERCEPGRWLDTRDLVRREGDALIYAGRVDHNFKLSNGRMVDAARIEDALRASHESVIDAAVYSPDGERLCVCLVLNRDDQKPDMNGVRAALGPLAERLAHVDVRRESAEIRTPKGSLDRARLLAAA